MSNFNLFFYYKNRSKIRNSFLLESISARLKEIILFHYREDNYKYIDNLIRIVKFFVFSLVYLIMIISVDFNYDSLHMIGYVVFAFFGFFIALVSLSYNRESLKNVEHDHYFRMLSENRNELLKQITFRRVNYGFFNWLIPFSFPLFFFAAIFTSFHFIIQYIVLLVLYYLFIFVFIFATQKLIFKYLKKTIIIGDILIYLFSVLIVGFPIVLHFLMLMLAGLFDNYIGALLIYSSLSVLLIFALWSLRTLVYKTTYNYSITNTLLVGYKKNYKGNKLKKPSLFIKLFYGKDDFSNVLLTKDLLSFYRKDKRETFSLIFVSVLSFVYSGFLISSLQTDDSIVSIFPVDNIILSMIMIFFVITNYRYKEMNWYSSEDRNLELFKRLKHEPIKIYKSKLKLNSILLLPMILIYAISPLFFILTFSDSGMIYSFIRIVFVVMYALILLEYPLINDARKTIVKKYKDVLFMGAGDLSMFIFFVQGIGLTVLLTYISTIAMVSQYPYVYWIVIGLLFAMMIIMKIRFLIIRRSFKREEV